MAVGTDPRQQIRLGNPGRFLLDIGQRVRGEIPIGPLPRIGGLSRLGGFGFGSNRVSMRLVPGDPPSTLVTVRLRLPSWLSIGGLAAEGEATFRATPDHGLVLQDMRIGLIDVDLGAAAIKAFQIRYRSETGEWEGSGKACVISGCLEANVLIAGDELQRLWASMPLPPPGVTLFPFVQLNRVDFGGARTPTRFFGGAGITAYGIYDITARATLAFPGTNAPFSLDPTESPGFPRELYGVRRTGLTLAATGDAAIKVPIFDRVPFARGHFLYEYPGYFALGGELDQRFGPLKLDGRMAGAFNAGNGRFNVEGGVETCFTGFTDVVGVVGVSIDLNVCRGGNGVFSNRGAAGCAKIIWRFGVGYDFRTDTPSFWPFGCEWERYRELDVRGNTARAAAAGFRWWSGSIPASGRGRSPSTAPTARRACGSAAPVANAWTPAALWSAPGRSASFARSSGRTRPSPSCAPARTGSRRCPARPRWRASSRRSSRPRPGSAPASAVAACGACSATGSATGPTSGSHSWRSRAAGPPGPSRPSTAGAEARCASRPAPAPGDASWRPSSRSTAGPPSAGRWRASARPHPGSTARPGCGSGGADPRCT